MKHALLKAARADHIPVAHSGPWHIKKIPQTSKLDVPMPNAFGRRIWIEPGLHTYLYRYTEATLHTHGDLVMKDTRDELETHLDFMLKARGRVLITGLGLGCVARGCLANPRVESVTVIERDPDVLRLVRPHFLTPAARLAQAGRYCIIEACAIEWAKNTAERFDCAWHDLWSDPDAQEAHLSVIHSELLSLLCERVDFQGAWAFPRTCKRLWQRLIPII